MKNKIPDWLNIFLVICIFLTLLIGATIFLTDFDHSLGTHNYEAFFPSGLCVVFYFAILFISNLFTNSDFATVMMVTLLIVGLTILGLGIIAKNESTKSTAFEIASPILGLALGIPFGERLRAVPGIIAEDEKKIITKQKKQRLNK